MARLHIEHFFDGITPAEFWSTLLNKEYDQGLKPALGVKERVELERRDDGKKLFRRIRMVPGFPVPAAVQKALDNVEIEYIEESTYDRARGVLDWAMTPNVLRDRVVAKGQVIVTPERGGVRRAIEGEISVRMMGLGGMMEKVIIANTERSYENATTFTREWIRQGRHKGLAVA